MSRSAARPRTGRARKRTRQARRPALWREELKRVWRDLRGSALSPGRAAAAVALGVFIGSQPIFGCHTPLVLVLCLVLRLDAAICWVAANISNPLFAPFLLTAEVQVGAYLRTGQLAAFDTELARQTGVAGFAGYALLGAPVVGASLAALLGGLVWLGMAIRCAIKAPPPREPYRLPANAPAWWHAAERLASRYAPRYETEPAQRAHFHYVRIKLIGDPICKLVADVAGTQRGALGELLDVGAGRGQLSLMLLELGRARSARGFDWDEAKIAEANKAAARAGQTNKPLPATFCVADMREAELEPADTVLLVDVIHYLTIAEQDEVLARAADAVRPGGRLLVREADTERGWRSWATLAEELLFTALRFNRGARVKLRPARDIARLLEARGLRAEVRPAWGSTPFSNVLVVANRAKLQPDATQAHGTGASHRASAC